jgi:hypothetical protein
VLVAAWVSCSPILHNLNRAKKRGTTEGGKRGCSQPTDTTAAVSSCMLGRGLIVVTFAPRRSG